jgi:hypothetical protein
LRRPREGRSFVGMKAKWFILALGVTLFLLAWGGVGAALILKADLKVHALALVVAGFATKGLIWSLVIALGISVAEMRGRIGQWWRKTLRRP